MGVQQKLHTHFNGFKISLTFQVVLENAYAEHIVIMPCKRIKLDLCMITTQKICGAALLHNLVFSMQDFTQN